MKNLFLTLILITATVNLVHAQRKWGTSKISDNATLSSNDSLMKKINGGYQRAQPLLYGHFDKTIYTTYENIWFTAYLLRKGVDFKSPEVLVASLVKADKSSILITRRFRMANGIGTGNLFLADSIPPGNYFVVLYTDQSVKSKPSVVYYQPIVIKDTKTNSFNIEAANVDSTNYSECLLKIPVTIVKNGGTPVKGGKLNFRIYNDSSAVYSQVGATNANGKYVLTITSDKLPAVKSILEIVATYDNDTKSTSVLLPARKRKLSVKFYPEGGYLLHATSDVVGWELKTNDGQPVKAKAILLADNLPIDTISTDKFGLGKFRLMPMIEKKYSARVKVPGIADSVYNLPIIILKTPVIQITKALVNDTVRFKIQSKFPQKVTWVVHNAANILASYSLLADAAGRHFAVDLKSAPRGLTTLTVLDSLQRPVAERLFFAHFDAKSHIQISLDKTEYGKRDAVSLKLRLDGAQQAVVSVACVERGKLQPGFFTDIESYFYLKHDLAPLPVKERYYGNSAEDKDFLEKVLLIKGWTRYKWLDSSQTSRVVDSVAKIGDLNIHGVVEYNNYPVKRRLKLLVMADSTTRLITTDELGKFTLDNSTIITDVAKKVRVLILDKNVDNYNIYFFDPLDRFIKKSLLNLNFLYFLPLDYDLQNSLQVTGFEHTVQLREVQIKGARYNSRVQNPASFDAVWGRNACGDYVCYRGVLNCVNHQESSGNHPPVVGNTYLVVGKGYVKYEGCSLLNSTDKRKRIYTLDGVKFSKEFYGPDYTISSENNYTSTLYWKGLLKIGSREETKISFSTCDLPGDFRVVVQGITDSDVTFSAKDFTIK